MYLVLENCLFYIDYQKKEKKVILKSLFFQFHIQKILNKSTLGFMVWFFINKCTHTDPAAGKNKRLQAQMLGKQDVIVIINPSIYEVNNKFKTKWSQHCIWWSIIDGLYYIYQGQEDTNFFSQKNMKALRFIYIFSEEYIKLCTLKNKTSLFSYILLSKI